MIGGPRHNSGSKRCCVNAVCLTKFYERNVMNIGGIRKSAALMARICISIVQITESIENERSYQARIDLNRKLSDLRDALELIRDTSVKSLDLIRFEKMLAGVAVA